MKKIIIFSFLGLSLILVGCGAQITPTAKQNQISNQSQPVTAENTTNITIQNFAFNPVVLTVTKGTTVTWTNNDSVTHQIKSETFNSDRLGNGESFSFTFNQTGNFDYVCAIHSTMKGKIIVN
jgi:plastocyanin